MSRLEICYKYPVIMYHAKQNADITGFYNPAAADGIFDLRNAQSIISKDLFIRIFGLDSKDRYYLWQSNIYLDMNSNMSTITLDWISKVKNISQILTDEFEEFFLFIEENLADYLLEHPEDNLYGGNINAQLFDILYSEVVQMDPSAHSR